MMTEYKIKEILRFHNGRRYDSIGEQGLIPVYGSGGIMGYTDKPLLAGEYILLPRKGSLNNYFYINKPFWNVDTIYAADVIKNDVDCKYLYYYFKCLNLGNLDSGSTLPSMTQSAYGSIKVKLPSHDTQKTVANFLTTIDDKIATNNKIIETSEKLMREIYDYWFVQFDFPDENGRPYKSSGGEMVYNETLKREIPKGWKPSSISDVVSLNARGITQKEPTKDSEKIAVVNQKCIRDGNIDSRELYWHNSEVKFKECLKLEFMDTLVNSMGVGTLGRISPFILNMEAVPHSCVSLLRYKDGVSTKCWLYSQVKNLEPYITSIGVGSTGQQSLTNKDLGEIKIAVPPIHLMTTFDEVANPIMRSIMNLNEENAKLISLRDWLLPMIMNGQIKVSE